MSILFRPALRGRPCFGGDATDRKRLSDAPVFNGVVRSDGGKKNITYGHDDTNVSYTSMPIIKHTEEEALIPITIEITPESPTPTPPMVVVAPSHAAAVPTSMGSIASMPEAVETTPTNVTVKPETLEHAALKLVVTPPEGAGGTPATIDASTETMGIVSSAIAGHGLSKPHDANMPLYKQIETLHRDVSADGELTLIRKREVIARELGNTIAMYNDLGKDADAVTKDAVKRHLTGKIDTTPKNEFGMISPVAAMHAADTYLNGRASVRNALSTLSQSLIGARTKVSASNTHRNPPHATEGGGDITQTEFLDPLYEAVDAVLDGFADINRDIKDEDILLFSSGSEEALRMVHLLLAIDTVFDTHTQS